MTSAKNFAVSIAKHTEHQYNFLDCAIVPTALYSKTETVPLDRKPVCPTARYPLPANSDCRPVHGAGSAGVLFFLASLRISNPKTRLDARVCEFSEQQLCFQAVGTNGLSFQGDMFWTAGVLE